MTRFADACVADYMSWPVVTIAPDASLREIGRCFSQHDFNALPVVEAGRLAGIVTKFDLLKAYLPGASGAPPPPPARDDLTARAIMTREVVTFRPTAPLARVLRTLVDFRIKSFPVVEGYRLLGMIARSDIARALHQSSGVQAF